MLEVVTRVNLLEVRWKVANEMGPCSHPTFIEASNDGTLVIAYMSQKIHRHHYTDRSVHFLGERTGKCEMQRLSTKLALTGSH